jgi:hypothetical protein
VMSLSPTASSTASYTTLTASNSAASRCARCAPKNPKPNQKPEFQGFYTNWGRGRDSDAVPSSALHPARKWKSSLPTEKKTTASLRCAPDQTRCSHKTGMSQVNPTENRLSLDFLTRNSSIKTCAETKK